MERDEMRKPENEGIETGGNVSAVSRPDGSEVRGKKLPQYVAGLSASLGAFSAGLVYGWTSPAGEDGANLIYAFDIDSEDFSWISSIFNVGAATICIPVGILTNVMGRRRSMLLMTLPFTVGWACVIWPSSLGLLIFGRFLLGVGGGAFCVTAPMYTAEISDTETRGRLGSYFELLLCAGILVSYALGLLLNNMHVQSLISASVPLMFFGIFFFMPETPTYYLMKNDEKGARETLVWLRGQKYNVESEMAEQRKTLADARVNRVPLLTALRSPAAVKGIFIGYGLMFFQCFSGVDAIIFYANTIFRDATGHDSQWSTIVTSSMQVTAVFLFTLVVDKWGRRPLLVVSGTAMFLSLLVLGVYFYLDSNGSAIVEAFRWLPIVCISAFNIAVSFGFDPIPWMMIGELFSPQIKGIAGSSACLLNWLMSFLVTKFFSALKKQIGAHGTFWIFSGICALSVAFVVLAVPETKGKTLDEIQKELASSATGENTDKLDPRAPDDEKLRQKDTAVLGIQELTTRKLR
ncbi:facilitated trehalose transporter Tret1-2 homolog [Venturia canescens]|uniref:facilitated trehalose transporter Tret1-2 homolog n=1 Tax=Venturia canescens TaxID=32260 RepID=UPI001C9C5316|nr:facilitated trehalose transporter Tret1-2 homolog [Venturia canescens]